MLEISQKKARTQFPQNVVQKLPPPPPPQKKQQQQRGW